MESVFERSWRQSKHTAAPQYVNASRVHLVGNRGFAHHHWGDQPARRENRSRPENDVAVNRPVAGPRAVHCAQPPQNPSIQRHITIHRAQNPQSNGGLVGKLYTAVVSTLSLAIVMLPI